uniref:Uncharacterized protein n=1 Tax=Arundo donax TaxID=35708 RepID=A0A0A9BLI9_ARUDO
MAPFRLQDVPTRPGKLCRPCRAGTAQVASRKAQALPMGTMGSFVPDRPRLGTIMLIYVPCYSLCLGRMTS